ncbi:hypothetical protein [Actinomadura geliboluensis]|uniref:hypothetical protein n=1 Tax=Actinomadura geliboluensis TaxID=882440 RepID=UPI002604A710|nr:hypothetical protein [Actinomadura geliboluensis]
MTIEKIPIVTESTAAQPAVDERGDVAAPGRDIDSVLWGRNASESASHPTAVISEALASFRRHPAHRRLTSHSREKPAHYRTAPAAVPL